MSDQTPTRIEVDCSTGETMEVPLTAAELAAAEQERLVYEARQETERARDEELRSAVAAHSDPVVKALAERLGVA